MPSDTQQELLKMVRSMQTLPLQYTAWLRGVALRRHLSEATGLSPARLANPAQELRPKRSRKVHEHAQQRARKNLENAGLRAQDVEAVLERQREVGRAGGTTWAGFWQDLDYPVPAERELDACVASAVALDQLLAAVAAAAQDDHARDAAAAFEEFAQGLGLPHDFLAPEDKPGLRPADWRGVTQWRDVAVLGQHLLLVAYVDQFAHVDAVWGSAFVQQLQPRPLFLLVAPRRPGEAGVDRPVRRLLEVCHALHHWAKYGAWPARPARPAELNEIFEMDVGRVYNWFDGTTKLLYSQFEKAWPRFAAQFKLDREVQFPALLVAVAICWQRSLIEVDSDQKLKSFVVLDEGYTQLWRWRRSQLAAPSAGTAPWAAWMDDG